MVVTESWKSGLKPLDKGGVIWAELASGVIMLYVHNALLCYNIYIFKFIFLKCFLILVYSSNPHT